MSLDTIAPTDVVKGDLVQMPAGFNAAGVVDQWGPPRLVKTVTFPGERCATIAWQAGAFGEAWRTMADRYFDAGVRLIRAAPRRVTS